MYPTTTSQKTLVYCGVNCGQTFRRLAPHFNHAIGFEPIPSFVAALEDEFREQPNVSIIHGALSTKDGSVTLNIYDHHMASSIGTLSDTYAEKTGNKFKLLSTITAPSYHLGHFLKRHALEEIDTLITDVQGMDLTILKTIEHLIRRRAIRLIQCEVEQPGFENSYEGTPTNQEKNFRNLFRNDYELLHRHGGPSWAYHDLTWIRTGETDRWSPTTIGIAP